MTYIDYALEGLRNLYYSKLRSLLALLGVLVGSASVVAMVMGGELATNEALKQFKSLGTDLLAATINTPSDNQLSENKNLNLSEALALIHANASILQVAPYTQLFQPIFYNGNEVNGVILGVTDDFASVVNVKLMSGRFVSLLDRYQLHCVIGQHVYTQMKKLSHQEPLGQQLQIGNQLCVIVGVAAAWQENNFVYANIDDAILTPLLASTVINNAATINNIILKLSSHANIFQVEEAITKSINAILPDKQLSFRSAKELIAKMEKQSDILTIFLGLIGCVSLLVGGIGVMNIMLVSVIERRREIGIRLAVGAKRYDIAVLFLMEAIMLSLVGGVLGVVLGVMVAYGIAWYSHWQFVLFLWPPLAGFSVSVAVGIFFGFYPAYLAAKLDPIEALRME